jgi:hypothetical protein
MQSLELLRENLEIIFHAVHDRPEASLIEETGNFNSDDYCVVVELNDELFFFHFSNKTICRLIVFENVPEALRYLHALESK